MMRQPMASTIDDRALIEAESESATALNEISWAKCGTSAKASVSFYTTPMMDFDSDCVSYPNNPAETD